MWPTLPDVSVSANVLESTEESGSLTQSLCSVVLMNPRFSLSLLPRPCYFEDSGDALPLRIVLVSTLGLLNFSMRFLLAWPICRLCIAVSSRLTLPGCAVYYLTASAEG